MPLPISNGTTIPTARTPASIPNYRHRSRLAVPALVPSGRSQEGDEAENEAGEAESDAEEEQSRSTEGRAGRRAGVEELELGRGRHGLVVKRGEERERM